MTGVIRRDVDRAEGGLRRLGQEQPRHPDLVALTVLVEALTAPALAAATHVALTERIELTERRLVQAARRFLGADADAFLRPVWQALAATAADLPFEPAHPRAHRAWLCQQYGEWTAARTAVEDEPCWADTPLLRYWMGLAQHHLGAPEVAIRLWLPLCWMDPLLFETCAPTAPNPTIRAAWVAFERVLPFEESLADRAPAAAWFPAWLLLRHRALSRLFRADDIPDAGDAARVFRHLLALLPLEQGGLTDELVRQRRALRQLDDSFFRYCIGGLERTSLALVTASRCRARGRKPLIHRTRLAAGLDMHNAARRPRATGSAFGERPADMPTGLEAERDSLADRELTDPPKLTISQRWRDTGRPFEGH